MMRHHSILPNLRIPLPARAALKVINARFVSPRGSAAVADDLVGARVAEFAAVGADDHEVAADVCEGGLCAVECYAGAVVVAVGAGGVGEFG